MEKSELKSVISKEVKDSYIAANKECLNINLDLIRGLFIGINNKDVVLDDMMCNDIANAIGCIEFYRDRIAELSGSKGIEIRVDTISYVKDLKTYYTNLKNHEYNTWDGNGRGGKVIDDIKEVIGKLRL